MRFTIFYSLVVALVGLVLYFRAKNPKWQECGRIMFAAGLFAFSYQLGGRVITAGTP